MNVTNEFQRFFKPLTHCHISNHYSGNAVAAVHSLPQLLQRLVPARLLRLLGRNSSKTTPSTEATMVKPQSHFCLLINLSSPPSTAIPSFEHAVLASTETSWALDAVHEKARFDPETEQANTGCMPLTIIEGTPVVQFVLAAAREHGHVFKHIAAWPRITWLLGTMVPAAPSLWKRSLIVLMPPS